MSPMKRYANKQAKARKRRRLKAHERLKQQRAQAQQYIAALHQALKDLDFPDTLVAEIEGRLQAQQKLLGKIVALMFPTLFGCRHGHELTRVRGWDKNVPSRLLNALPKRSWLKRLRRLGLEMLVSIGRHTQDKSASTHSRWQWRWIVDDAVFRKLGFYHLSSFRCSDLGCWVYYENTLPSPPRSEHRPSIPCGGSRA